MAAKDYRICCGLAEAYISKVTKTGKMSATDRELISDNVIMTLIVWWIRKRLQGTKNKKITISQGDKPIIEITLLEE